jgi:hypothetical protein
MHGQVGRPFAITISLGFGLLEQGTEGSVMMKVGRSALGGGEVEAEAILRN